MAAPKYVRHSGKQAMAQNVFLSWCRALEVPVTMKADSLFDVTTATGSQLEVSILPAASSKLGVMNLPVERLGSFDRNEARPAFGVFLKAAGYGDRKLPDRGASIGNGHGDFFLMALRYSEFRDAPDPPKSLVEMLSPTMHQEIHRFYRKMEWLCRPTGTDIGDLETFGLLWIATFVHRYWVQVETHEDGSDNKRLFRAFIRQRLSHLRTHLQRQFRASNLDDLTAKTHLYSDFDLEQNPFDDCEDDEESLRGQSPRLADAITEKNRVAVLDRLRTILSENIYEPAIKKHAKKLLMAQEQSLQKQITETAARSLGIPMTKRGITTTCPVCGVGPGMHKCCKVCKASANSEQEIEAIFGFRVASKGSQNRIPQPWCRKCRSKHTPRAEGSPVILNVNKDVSVADLRGSME